MRLVNQYNDSFLVARRGRQTYLLDQHSLAEALNYAALRAELRAGRLVRSQALAHPRALRLAAAEAAELATAAAQRRVARLGFQVAAEGGGWALRAVGQLFGRLLGEEELRAALAGGLEAGGALPPALHAALAMRACKTAVRLGDPLAPAAQAQLLARARAQPDCLNCPHGRPSVQAVFR